MMLSRRDLQHNVGPKTWGWRAIILSKVLYFGSWKSSRVWQKSLHKDLITYLNLDHLNGSLFNFLKPTAHCWYTEVMILE
jgi:hypothetical protein